MMATAPAPVRVPVIPEPPFDPTSLLINDRIAWWIQQPDGLDGLDDLSVWRFTDPRPGSGGASRMVRTLGQLRRTGATGKCRHRP